MQYDFDTPIDWTHTWSIKHDFKKENGKADDILPLWVADMDFRSPDSVVEALKKAVDHGIFGYSRADESYFDAVAAWYQKRHHLTLQPEWMTCITLMETEVQNPGEPVVVTLPSTDGYEDLIGLYDGVIESEVE